MRFLSMGKRNAVKCQEPIPGGLIPSPLIPSINQAGQAALSPVCVPDAEVPGGPGVQGWLAQRHSDTFRRN